MVCLNLEPLLKEFQSDIQRWQALGLSLWGKINVIKMNLAPRLNYISSMLPVAIQQREYTKFQLECKKYLWNGKKPRAACSKLYSKLNSGGLGLPNFYQYYVALMSCHIASWLWSGDDGPTWVRLEQSLVGKPSYSLPVIALNSELLSHPTLRPTQVIWRKLARLGGFHPGLGLGSSLWYNEALKIGKHPFYWLVWERAGICLLRDLYSVRGFRSFAKIRAKYDLLENEWWRCQQLCSLLKSTLGRDFRQWISPRLIQVLEKGHKIGYLASKIYSSLVDLQKPSMEPLVEAWERIWVCLFLCQLGNTVGETCLARLRKSGLD
nr:PREDICTED: uncharacterized protein LOC106702717 [Latimeria chalumnae]|eukprot:XP_014341197.1 PREDICTED: uncharacterized protein LOC106702717 [Latimeria chalumnae]